jgi:hypothetical protein
MLSGTASTRGAYTVRVPKSVFNAAKVGAERKVYGKNAVFIVLLIIQGGEMV